MSSGLPIIPQFFERFIFNWAEKRQPVPKQEITINRKRLYILPTRHGITYFFVILLILFGAINYENSLGYMLTFLLGSLAFIGMIYTHMNLSQLTVKIGRAEPVFAGQDILFPVNITHSCISTHPNLKLLSDSGQITTTHLLNNQSTQCKLTLSSQHRGYQPVGKIKLYTEYPLGLFHAWSWLKLDSQCLVYPAADSHHYPLKLSEYDNTGTLNSDKQGVDDFAGIRQYTPGDPPNHMAWKAIAKTGELQTKLFNSDSIQKAWINWSSTSEQLDTEKRLSILCRMVIDASDNNIVFGFDIPGLNLSPACGLEHKHRCLKALALFGQA